MQQRWLPWEFRGNSVHEDVQFDICTELQVGKIIYCAVRNGVSLR